MRIHRVIVGALAGLLITSTAALAAELKPGDEAPRFVLPDTNGKQVSLADYRKKKVVVIAWYPKAFTGG